MQLLQRHITAVLLTGASLSLMAATFTTDHTIEAGDFSLEGEEIVVTGCQLTVDGAHTFASLTLLDGATLRHAAAGVGDRPERRVDLRIAGEVRIAAGAGRVGAFGCRRGLWQGAGS